MSKGYVSLLAMTNDMCHFQEEAFKSEQRD
jgi:hypothetical protein